MKIIEIEQRLLAAAAKPDMNSIRLIVSGLTEGEVRLLSGKVVERVFHIVISYTKVNPMGGTGTTLLFMDKLGHRLSQDSIGSALGHLLRQRRTRLSAVG